MKNILCFGDSNTWGWDPIASQSSPFPVRHLEEVRWTGIAQKALGPGFRLLEEGLNGRTTVHDDPIEESRNGRTYLIPCLLSQQPLDVVVLMLGVNDLKTRFGLPPADVAEGASLLVDLIQKSSAGRNGGAPAVLLVSPPSAGDMSHLPELAEKFADAEPRSLRLPELYRQVAKLHGCAYLDSQPLVVPSRIDGLHLEASEHAKLGLAIAEAVRAMF